MVRPRGVLARQRKVAWLRRSVPRAEFSFLLEDRASLEAVQPEIGTPSLQNAAVPVASCAHRVVLEKSSDASDFPAKPYPNPHQVPQVLSL